MKNLSIGIQTFSELIEKGCIYVDKTKIIHEMITTGKYYFLSRPRRFGKSLLVSTLASIFSGQRELFKDLAIDSLLYEWKKHPVVMISLSDIPCTSPEALEKGIKKYLYAIAQEYDLILDDELSSSEMLRELVIQLAKNNKVVLLIDEYDYPILQHVHESSVAVKMRDILKNFYIVIKGLDPYIAFVLLAGVSKFSKTSIFSGLNNLHDISLSAQYNTLLGYTKEEIITSFESYLTKIIKEQASSLDSVLADITTWYDGYRFTYQNDSVPIYNPFSLLLFLSTGTLSTYWFETGTPTFLINLLKARNYPILELEGVVASEGELGSFEVDDIDLKALLFQTGYLTINHYDKDSRTYTLGYPNKECAISFTERVLKSMTQMSGGTANTIAARLFKAFVENNPSQIKDELSHFFSLIPYTIQMEAENYYQTIFYIILKMIGADIIVEQPTNIGRIDAVIQTKNHCFIIEFKINATANKAMQQIVKKKYYEPYESLGKKIVLIGIVFDTVTRNISDFMHKEL